MSKSDVFANDLLMFVFNDANITITAGSLYVALHTADPGKDGDQTTNETGYAGYARVGVARSAAGFGVVGRGVGPVNNVTFTECTADPGKPITHFSIGTSTTGAGKVLYSGTVTPKITMVNGRVPVLAKTTVITEE